MAGLKFRVLLDSIENTEVYRDILVSEEFNFEQFYHTIIDTFGLSKDQMASFFVSDEEWDRGEELSLLDMSFESSFDESEAPKEMRKILIKDRINNLNQRFILIHDFLSMWIFLIELTEIVPGDVEKPEILLSIGEIPEELKKTGPNRDDFKFESEFNPDADPFDLNGFDDFDDDEFYDDYNDYDL